MKPKSKYKFSSMEKIAQQIADTIYLPDLYELLSVRIESEIQECEDEVIKYNDYLCEMVMGRSSAEAKKEKAAHRKSIKFWEKRKTRLLNLKHFTKESKLILNKMIVDSKQSGEIVWGVYEQKK
jgi:hypothetical protein